MILYLSIIIFANILIDVFGIWIFKVPLSWQLIVSYTMLCTVTCFVIDLLIALLIRSLPEKLFNPNSKAFKIYDWEQKFYNFIGIKFYKDKIPDLGKGFRKNKIYEPKNPDYLYKYMLECCYGEVIHLVSVPFAFFAMLVVPLKFFLQISLSVIIVNAILCLIPFFVLRYNRKKVKRIYDRLKVE